MPEEEEQGVYGSHSMGVNGDQIVSIKGRIKQAFFISHAHG